MVKQGYFFDSNATFVHRDRIRKMKRYASILNEGSLAGISAFVFFIVLFLFMGREYLILDSSEDYLKEIFTIRIHPFGGIRIIGVLIPLWFMSRALRKYRDTEGEGVLSYGEGFRLGVMFTFVFASLSGMFVFLFGALIDAGFVDFANEADLRLLEVQQQIRAMSEADYEEAREILGSRDVVDFAIGDFWSKTLTGFILALILSAIIKKNPPTFVRDE